MPALSTEDYVNQPIDIAQVEYWLGEWRYWMNSRSTIKGGARGSGMWGFAKRAVNEDYDFVVQDQQNAAASIAIDAKIDSLPAHESAALYRAYDLCSVWTFKRLDYQTTVADAKEHLGALMRKDGWPC